MVNREKLEIPTIEFTSVTLLNSGGNSSCTCVDCKKNDCPSVLTFAGVGVDDPPCGSEGAW